MIILGIKISIRVAVVFSMLLLFFFLGHDGQAGEETLPFNNPAQPDKISIDGDIREWEGLLPTFKLHKFQPGSRDGVVWIGQTDKGIVIAGKVYGDRPRWPKSSDNMAASDHVEVWISDATELKMPPIGWGMQFGFNSLMSEEDCNRPELKINDESKNDTAVKECKSWYASQVKYRKAFQKLFIRQWQVSPEIAIETYSAPAFNSLDASLQKDLQLLKPSGSPVGMFSDAVRKDQAYSFELLIPWDTLPPMKPLRLSDIRIMVDVFSPGPAEHKYGDYSSTATARKYAQPDTFNGLRLQPLDYFITSCKYDMPNVGSEVMPPNAWQDPFVQDPSYPGLIASRAASVYFIPTATRDVTQLLLIDNQAGGYFWHPDPVLHSPIISTIKYFIEPVSSGETVCGPQLAYSKRDKVYKSTNYIEHRPFEIKKKSDGAILVKEGPDGFQSRFGSGYCGACPWAMLKIYFIDALSGEIAQAFEYEKRLEGSDDNDIVDIDIHISENWDTFTVFEEHLTNGKTRNEQVPKWSATKYCLNMASKKYKECGKKCPSAPPAYRVLSFSKYKG